MTRIPAVSIVGTWLRLLVFQGAGLLLAAGTVAVASLAVPPAVYGQYGLLLSIVQIASGIGLAWVSQGLLRVGREEFREHGRSSDSLAAALVLTGGLLVTVLVLALAGRTALAGQTGLPAGLLWVVAPGLVAFAACEIMSYAAQANGRLDGYAGGQLIVRAGPFFGVLFMLAGWAADASFLITCAALGWAAAALYTGVAVFAGGFRPTPAWPRQIGRIIAYGRWLPLASAAGLASAWMGLWFVRGHVGLGAAGVLLWAMGLFSLLTSVLQPLGAILAPRMVDLRLTDDKVEIQYRIELIQSVGLLAAASMPAALGVCNLIGGPILPANYAAAAPLLIVLFAAFPTLLVASALAPLLGAFEAILPRIVSIHVGAALFNLSALALLVPRYGALGAALSSTLTVIATTAGFTLLARQVGDSAGKLGSLVARYLLISLLPIAIAVLLLQLHSGFGLALGWALSIALIIAIRAAGALLHLSALTQHCAALPTPVARFAVRLLGWVSGQARPNPTAGN